MAVKIRAGNVAASTTEGNRQWTSPESVLIPAGSAECDTRSKNSSESTLIVSDFQFGEFENVPEITGIEVSVRRRCGSNDNARDSIIRLADLRVSNYVGQNKATPTVWGTTFETVTYGGKNDLWGLSQSEVNDFLTPSRDVVSQLAVGIKAEQGRVRTYIEYVTLSIYYRIKETYQRINGVWVAIEPNLPNQPLGTIQRRDVRVNGQWVNVFTD